MVQPLALHASLGTAVQPLALHASLDTVVQPLALHASLDIAATRRSVPIPQLRRRRRCHRPLSLRPRGLWVAR